MSIVRLQNLIYLYHAGNSTAFEHFLKIHKKRMAVLKQLQDNSWNDGNKNYYLVATTSNPIYLVILYCAHMATM